MKLATMFFCILFFIKNAGAQGVSISSPASSADASAILDLKSNTQGLLIPRMSAAAKDLIAFPAKGLLVYQNDGESGLWFYDGNIWQPLQDNLGNYTMTKNLVTNGYFLSKDGSNQGLQVDDNGTVKITATNTYVPAPTQRFIFDNTGGLLAKGDLGVGIIPATGKGDRMMWYPYKAAFRVGGVAATEWDDVNVGFYSTALGLNCKASYIGSFAGGDGSVASGATAFSFGTNNISSGPYSTATGANSIAAGTGAVAMGYSNHAYGTGSVAIGYRCSATDNYSVAIGYRASSNHFSGGIVFGDGSSADSVLNTANYQFAARYAGGYRLYSNAAKTVGATLVANGNSWSTISDSTQKENFTKADGSYFLNRLTGLRLGSWNYKGQDTKDYRHYGPMAQEIYSAFGKDKYGKIGSDTLLAGADMDGIMMIMLQELEKRSTQQDTEIARITKENNQLKLKLAEIDTLKEQLLAIKEAMLKDERTVLSPGSRKIGGVSK